MNESEMLIVIHASAHDLRQVGDKSVQCIVTSPPYWGLRAYSGEQDVDWPAVTYRLNEWTEPITVPEWRCPLGLEPSPVAYIGHLILCLREWGRVLRDDGICWTNLGDSYAGSWGDSGHRPERSGVPGHQREKSTEFFDRKGHPQASKPVTASVPGLKPKDLVGIPFLFALAARADGWWLRSSIPWIKRNGLPGSQQDRPTNSHETWFMLTKSPTYYYDQDAVRIPVSSSSSSRLAQDVASQTGTSRAHGGRKSNGNLKAVGDVEAGRYRRTSDWFFDSLRAILDGANALLQDDEGEPLALVINPQPFREAHYAVFPERMIEPLILASTSEAGCCPQCGTPLRRQIAKPDMKDRPTRKEDAKSNTDAVHVSNNWQDHPKSAGQEYQEWRNANPDVTTGWVPTCVCGAPSDWLSDDLEVILSPTGSRSGDDPSLQTGRAGMNRPRGENEGQRPITRYEQRHYAAQLRDAAHRAEMEDESGQSFAHYLRTDRSGSRPVPDDLLKKWLDIGWLDRVTVPAWSPLSPVPCVILDPFAGSGTTARVAIRLGRRAILADMSDEYLADLVPARTTVQMEML